MFFQRVKTGGLGHNAYVLGCGDGLAVVVDPRRDVGVYVDLARDQGLRIAYVLETHRQEDFEFGSRALADLTGAKIVAGRHALFGDADVRLGDGEALEVGDTRFVALETPGHTPESVCYAVYPKDAAPACWAVFTGDTLFVGSTGRTDLPGADRTADNAALLYDAVHRRIAPLGDQAAILPAHGAGSACGGDISERDDTTLGIEKATNPVFTESRERFVARKVAERLPRPPYFAHMERVNRGGGRPMVRPAQAVRLLTPDALRERGDDAVLIDTRTPDAFASAHIAGACNVWLGGLSTFAGWLATPEQPVFLVVDTPQDAVDAVDALARVGIDRVEGALTRGVQSWREQGLPIESIGTAGAQQCAEWLQAGRIAILDVRDAMEWRDGHIPGATHRYVGELARTAPPLPKDRRVVVHCSVGNRSGLAASLLRRHGYADVVNLLGGIKAWKRLGLPLEPGAR